MAQDDYQPHSVLRFYPTEEELISFYLVNKLQDLRTNAINRVIPVVHVYDHNPSHLPSKHISHISALYYLFIFIFLYIYWIGGNPINPTRAIIGDLTGKILQI